MAPTPSSLRSTCKPLDPTSGQDTGRPSHSGPLHSAVRGHGSTDAACGEEGSLRMRTQTSRSKRRDNAEKIYRQEAWRKAFTRENLVGTIIGGYIPMLIAFLIIALPLLWMVISSFKPPSEIVTMTPTVLPVDPTFANYEQVAARCPWQLSSRTR